MRFERRYVLRASNPAGVEPNSNRPLDSVQTRIPTKSTMDSDIIRVLGVAQEASLEGIELCFRQTSMLSSEEIRLSLLQRQVAFLAIHFCCAGRLGLVLSRAQK